MAQRIAVLNKQSIHEESTHDELMAKNGLYADMFKEQAKGYA